MVRDRGGGCTDGEIKSNASRFLITKETRKKRIRSNNNNDRLASLFALVRSNGEAKSSSAIGIASYVHVRACVWCNLLALVPSIRRATAVQTRAKPVTSNPANRFDRLMQPLHIRTDPPTATGIERGACIGPKRRGPMPRPSSSSSMALLLLQVVVAALLAATTQAFLLPTAAPRPLPAGSPASVRPPAAPIEIEAPPIRRCALLALQSTASGAAEPPSASSSETVLWLRGLSNTFDGTRWQFKDISLSLAKGTRQLVLFGDFGIQSTKP